MDEAERRSAGPAGEHRADRVSEPLVIDVTGLTKRFGERTVVDHFDIRVPKGAIYGFLGPNGSGKTTTIRMLCGLLTPDEGEGTCLGFDVRREAGRIKEEVGYMTQKFSYYEDLTIRENLDFVARMYRLDRRQAASGRGARGAGAGGPGEAARGIAVGRLEAAAGAGGVPAARTAIAAARRADGGRRSQGAARLLGRNPAAQRARRHGAGVDALHGRGGAVRFHHLHRLRQEADRRALERDPGAWSGSTTWRVEGPTSRGSRRGSRRSPASSRWRGSARCCMCRGRMPRCSKATVERLEAEGAHRWSLQVAGLEEAFIYLMAGARDNFAADPQVAA